MPVQRRGRRYFSPVWAAMPMTRIALPAGDKKDVAKLIDAFEAFCVGAVNIAYQRYVFYQRSQEPNERFDAFIGDLPRLAKSCQFEAMEDSHPGSRGLWHTRRCYASQAATHPRLPVK